MSAIYKDVWKWYEAEYGVEVVTVVKTFSAPKARRW